MNGYFPILNKFFRQTAIQSKDEIKVDFTSLLPQELILNIFANLDLISLGRTLQVCRLFYQIGGGSELWANLRRKSGISEMYFNEKSGCIVRHNLIEKKITGRKLFGIDHRGPILSIAFSKHGTLFATASADHTVCLWAVKSPVNTRRGDLLRTIRGHQAAVNSVAFSPINNLLATASADGTAKIWDLDGNLLQTLEGHEMAVLSIEFSPEGNFIATACFDGSIRIFISKSETEFTLLDTLPIGPRIWVACVSVKFLSCGSRLALLFDEFNINMGQSRRLLLCNREGWSDEENVEVTELKFFGKFSFALSPKNSLIAITSTIDSDCTACIIDFEGNERAVLSGHKDKISSIDFSPDGNLIVTASHDATICVWDLEGKLLWSSFITHPFNSQGISVTFSPDGRRIAVVSSFGLVVMFDFEPKISVNASKLQCLIA